ncbi:hypothetical protein C8F04DRAFT_1077642 [Mycena alexandri]|uniref:AMP-dependent synthetase/ligase domain-containing protein n=1 Tax=Mycena alexandri TaxID=1745969 RepID=A0AAD6TBB0_9AGAR|nr:hypothetical protein C8F04DRAFT_1077642 [Mycena alexandri]
MHPQGTNSTTFCPGALDGTLSFPQLLEHHLHNSPRHRAYIYDDGQGGIVSVDFAKYVGSVHAVCRRVLHDLGSSTKAGAVVAIFADADTLSFCILVAAIMRAGFVPFCLSPRNSAAGVANLFQHVTPAAVYISPDVESVMTETRGLCDTQFLVLQAPTFDQLQNGADCAAQALPVLSTMATEDTAIILHSSGSTSIFSKPIYLSHKMLFQYASIPWSGNEDHCGKVMAAQTLPNYHALGVAVGTWPFASGLTMAILCPTTPPIKPTPQNGLSGIINTRPDMICATPAFIETWSESANGLEMMKSVKAVKYIGAPLNKRVGDALFAKGVVLCSGYGAMEVGVVTPFFECHGENWDYFTVRKDIDVVRVPEGEGSPLYMHTYLVGPSYTTTFTNSTIDRRPGCSLSDLLEQHPKNPELHRIYGRKDDIIVLSSGLKISPGSVEAHITRNPLVQAAVVVGDGRTHPSIIIQLTPQSQLDLLDDTKQSKIHDDIWASVEEANKASPAHYQIARKMILLADPKKPFSLTSKLQPRRRTVLEDYAKDIDSAYM